MASSLWKIWKQSYGASSVMCRVTAGSLSWTAFPVFARHITTA